MTKYIEYSDPTQVGEGPSEWVEIVHRIRWEDAAKLMGWIHRDDPRGNLYKDDDAAAEDFLVVHWGRVVFL